MDELHRIVQSCLLLLGFHRSLLDFSERKSTLNSAGGRRLTELRVVSYATKISRDTVIFSEHDII